MSKFQNINTHVVVSVDDSKDDRFAATEWDLVKAPAKSTAKK